MTILAPTRNKYYLFGYPIAHSASPAFHNHIFQELGVQNHYANHETVHPENVDTDVKSDMLALISAPDFGGCSVTMPIKVLATRYVQRLGPAAKEIGSINTIFLEEENGAIVTVGENYDYLGVLNALVLSLPAEKRAQMRPFGNGSAFLIGGGGTTRAAVYALAKLHLSPIYLINRDPVEVQAIINHFPQYDLRPINSPESWTKDMAARTVVGVGAIPSVEPTTREEKNVYATVTKILDTSAGTFLEMCYKPRLTTIYRMAVARGWSAITGIEAMIEQGLAQQRAWLLHSIASPWSPQRCDLDKEVEASARRLVRNMVDL